jgi:DNA-directed RNA polymerase subunit K/omega
LQPATASRARQMQAGSNTIAAINTDKQMKSEKIDAF